MDMKRTDEELVVLYQQGERAEDAFLELYERHHRHTYAFFRRRIGVTDLAEEQNQALYLVVIQNLRSFRSECSFRTWLFALAHHQLSHLRRRWRVHVDEQPVEVPEELWETFSGQGGDDPERGMQKTEVERALRRCLWSLPEVERAVVLAQYYRGVTLREATEELALTNPSGARGVLIAAQRRLRKCLETSGVLGPIPSA